VAGAARLGLRHILRPRIRIDRAESDDRAGDYHRSGKPSAGDFRVSSAVPDQCPGSFHLSHSVTSFDRTTTAIIPSSNFRARNEIQCLIPLYSALSLVAGQNFDIGQKRILT